jgi:DNA-binding transcriptional regulator YhcF (GntR family)
MPTRRTDKVDQVKQRLVDRLQHGFYRAGDRFLSNRAVAELFGISYQTSHRLIAELCREGYLERRPQSGTFVPGLKSQLVGVQLLFNERAARAQSFGSKLLSLLSKKLEGERINWRLQLTKDTAALDGERLPIVWELPDVIAECVRQKCHAVMIDDRPASGLESLFIDSVSVDDYSGGACAAQLLRDHTQKRRGFAVVAGPKSDHRSQLRMQGFTSVLDAAIVQAGDWFYEDGYRVAEQAVRRAKAGLFCVNDQLASSIVGWCRDHGRRCPPIIGFDDAPVAESLNLSTISLPWEEIVDGVVRIAKLRLGGDRATSSHQMYQPRPLVRGFGPGDASDAA